MAIDDSVKPAAIGIYGYGGSPIQMGRPALGMKATTVRLPDQTLRRIESLVGNRQVASFIREAVDNELKRREPPKT